MNKVQQIKDIISDQAFDQVDRMIEKLNILNKEYDRLICKIEKLRKLDAETELPKMEIKIK